MEDNTGEAEPERSEWQLVKMWMYNTFIVGWRAAVGLYMQKWQPGLIQLYTRRQQVHNDRSAKSDGQ